VQASDLVQFRRGVRFREARAGLAVYSDTSEYYFDGLSDLAFLLPPLLSRRCLLDDLLRLAALHIGPSAVARAMYFFGQLDEANLLSITRGPTPQDLDLFADLGTQHPGIAASIFHFKQSSDLARRPLNTPASLAHIEHQLLQRRANRTGQGTITLPCTPPTSAQSLIAARSSSRTFKDNASVERNALATILQGAAGSSTSPREHHRHYPSAGGL
jgi:hypothetical protein